MAAPHELSTPINTINRENLRVLITNNILNNSAEIMSDSDTMETDSPIRKPCIQLISKKLFHSPMMSDAESADEVAFTRRNHTQEARKAKKRKQKLVPDSDENDIKRAYVSEHDKDNYSPEVLAGMRRKVLISLFHNKEYSMDVSM